jgi:addiction module RelE/StbE family toxin
MKVTLLPAAQDDLVDIGAYIAEDNPRRADTFVDDLRSRCEKLGDMPKAYPLVPRHEASGVRRCPFRDYLIFYRVTPEAVEVLHIVHGARDIDALLFPSD